MPPLVMGRDTPLYACLEKHEKFDDGYKMAAELRKMYDDRPRRQAGRRRGQGPRGPAPPGRHPRRRRGDHQATRSPSTCRSSASPRPGQDPEEAPVVTQYEMGGVEELGLLKMDFLGLRNLDVITDALAMIKRVPRRRRRHRRPSRSTTSRPSRCCAGATPSACSSWRAAPMRPLMRSLAPTAFEDVAALVALYRPGADGGEHAQRLRRPQERPEAGRPTSTPTPRSCWATPTA